MTGAIKRRSIDTRYELGNRALSGSKKNPSPTPSRLRRLTLENLYGLFAMRWCGSERERRHGHRRQLKFHAYFRKLYQRGFRGDANLPV